ncbi:hypothetical protein [Thioalbus denitrificans]|uniref:Secreted protein n=1 Tax=Thioalbus denitrificans TaxID=547122 RepID=A0A369CBT6_9GAMM|nr:hypothetical protein [Thioalbus denitrificans]RCX31163.1 hypothetical protein DFQ59_103127 [Thioalbus denitrificans]
MHKKWPVMASAVVLASASLMVADAMSTETVPMLSVNIPLDGVTAAQRAPVFSASILRMGEGADGQRTSLLDTSRPPILDLNFKQGGVESLNLQGVTLLKRVITYNADGSTSEGMAMPELTPVQWAMIGLGVAGVLCVTEVICDDDDGGRKPPADDVIADDVLVE